MAFKRFFLGYFFLILFSVNSFSQVAINSTGNTPDNSAMLDISASNKGLLIPRIALTGTSDITTINSPITSLLIYNTATVSDVAPGFYFFNGSEWTPVGEDAYTFENGLTESGSHTVGLGGTLSTNTTINFSSGFSNVLYYNLNNGSQFIIQNNGVDNVTFNDNGNVNYVGDISSGEYYNFTGAFGSSGFGFRQRSGDLQYRRNISEDWNDFPSSVAGTPYWWYRPTSATYIRPQNNDNIRIFDDNETYGLYFDGGTNQYGGYFRTTGNYATTAAVVGFSDVLGNQTKGYLGYEGTWTSANGDFDIDGMAVFGEVEDKGRTSIFGSTTRDATYAAIIGYTDVWIAGYYSVLDANDLTRAHPALYGQMIVKSDKSKNQAAVEGWSEYYAAGTDNRGYTVGGDFTAIGRHQDAKGIDVKAKSWGALTETWGGVFEVDSSETGYGIEIIVDSTINAYGMYINAGTQGISTKTYGIYSNARTSTGTGIIGIGSNASTYYLSTKGDGVIGVSDNGYGVYGQFDDGSGNLNIYGVLGYNNDIANYFYHNETTTTNGQSAGYFHRTRALRNDGASYSKTGTNQAVQGYNQWGDNYTFGVSGHSYNDYNRSGGVLGADYSGTYWGSLAYKNSIGNTYGGYFTSYTSGAGKGNNYSGVGIGVYSDFMGGWIHGDVYGATVKGDRYSLYVDGQTYTNDVIINLTDVGDNQRVATFVPTADKPTIYLSGIGKLSNGKASIEFENKYKQLIDENEPVIVTITPIGDCNGIHLTQSKSTGFIVSENAKGTSDVQFTWIAIAIKKGFNDNDIPTEVLDNNFDAKMNLFMFNENDTLNTAIPLWWNGNSIQNSAIPIQNSTKIFDNTPVFQANQNTRTYSNKNGSTGKKTININ
ncbi:MAG: hypothetical protein JXR36_02250 [Bacteroidales bacterium]|nr:hypothetical protein [Bacteroidales bacterium]